MARTLHDVGLAAWFGGSLMGGRGGRHRRGAALGEPGLRGPSTAPGALCFAYEGRFTSATFIDFCKRLHQDSDRPVFLVVDGHPTHRSRVAQEFVAATNGRLRLFLLPGYSPELNPDEWVWKNVKADRIGRAGVTAPTTSRPRPCPRCTGCRNSPTSFAASSTTRICATSLPNNPPTYDPIGKP